MPLEHLNLEADEIEEVSDDDLLEAAADRKALADDVEQRLRRRSPVLKFEAPGRRLVTVRMAGLDLEVPTVQAAVSRLALAQSRALADQIVASRNAGKSMPVKDWLTGMAEADDGLRQAVKMGIVKVSKITTKGKK